MGVIPYSQTASGVQDVFKIEDSLKHPKLVATLGEDRVFLLKSVLTGRTSANMRNLMSHGLLDYGHSTSVDSAYVWWLALHLVATIGKAPPQLAHLLQPAQPGKQDPSPSAPPETAGKANYALRGRSRISGVQSRHADLLSNKLSKGRRILTRQLPRELPK